MNKNVQVNSFVSSFNTGTIIAMNMLQNLKLIQNSLLSAITDIYHGRFNFHLLRPEQLISELSKISTQLPKDATLPIDNIHTELSRIYELLRVKTRMLKDALIFEIKLPLVSRDSFEILRLLPVPETNGNLAISIVPVADYISINMKKDVYLLLSENELQSSCLVISAGYFCNIRKPEYQVKEETNFCVKENSECKIINKPCKSAWKETTNLNTYIYFCCSHCNIKTICGDQVTAQQLTRAGLINIGQDCIVKTDEFTIMSYKPHQTEINMTPDLYTPYISSINHIINITIPKFTSRNESHRQEISEIGEQINKIKEAGALADTISYHDVHHYAMIYTVLGIIVIIGVVVIIRRAKCNWRVPAAPAPPAEEPVRAQPAPRPRAPDHAPAQPPQREDTKANPHFRKNCT